jgi:hypothetical protein
MGTYGRNVEFRIPPKGGYRGGRYSSNVTPLSGSGSGNGAAGTGLIPIGAPIVADNTAGIDALGRQIVKLAEGGSAPMAGVSGIAVYEYAPAAFAGFDPLLTTYSDLGTVPAGQACQLVNGSSVKVVLGNTYSEVFLGVRTYPGRIMVAGLSSVTPSVAVGNYLTPGTGDDTNGYWAVTGTLANAWMVVTFVDTVRVQVEARLVF